MEPADDLLQRALVDAQASVSVALKVSDLAVSEALTVIFHGRPDLATLQTYVTHGGRATLPAAGTAGYSFSGRFSPGQMPVSH